MIVSRNDNFNQQESGLCFIIHDQPNFGNFSSYLACHKMANYLWNQIHYHVNNSLLLVITKSAVSMFIEMLKNESWDNIFNHTDVHESFNLFLNSILIIFQSCCPMQYITKNVLNNQWITTGIKIPCKHKKFLYVMRKKNNFSKIKIFYIQYCRVSWKII